MELTAAQMIDITGMKTLYAHRENNPEIEHILQVSDNDEKLLGEIGQVMIDGDVAAFEKYITDGKIKTMHGSPVPATNAVYCLYLPPYYIFTDLRKVYE